MTVTLAWNERRIIKRLNNESGVVFMWHAYLDNQPIGRITSVTVTVVCNQQRVIMRLNN
jgi:hypothetical protein